MEMDEDFGDLEFDLNFKAYMGAAASLGNSNFSALDLDPEEVVRHLESDKRKRRTDAKGGGKKNNTAPAADGGKKRKFAAGAGKKTSGGDDDDEAVASDQEEDNEDERIVPVYVDEVATEPSVNSANAAGDSDDPRETGTQMTAFVSEEKIPGSIPALPVIWIRNVVLTCETGSTMNLDWLLTHGLRFGFSRNSKRFVAVIMRCENPRTSTLAFYNGKFVNTGSRKEEDARRSIELMLKRIRSIEDDRGRRPYEHIHIKSLRVRNMVGATRVPFLINLQVLAKNAFVRHVKKTFIGAIATVSGISSKLANRNVKALVFSTGCFVIMGAKSREHIFEVYGLLYPYLARAGVQDALPAEFRVTEAQRRRAKSDAKKIAELPPGSHDVIEVSREFQVAEFQRVNNNRITGDEVLRIEQHQRSGSLATVDRQTRNVLALRSMQESEEREDRRNVLRLTGSAAQTPLKQLKNGNRAAFKMDEDGNVLKQIRIIDPEQAASLYSDFPE